MGERQPPVGEPPPVMGRSNATPVTGARAVTSEPDADHPLSGGPMRWSSMTEGGPGEVDDAPTPFGVLSRSNSELAEVALEFTAELRRHPSLMQQLLDANPNPTFIQDLGGRFVVVNAAAAALIGLPREALIGCLERDVVSDGGALFRRPEEWGRSGRAAMDTPDLMQRAADSGAVPTVGRYRQTPPPSTEDTPIGGVEYTLTGWAPKRRSADHLSSDSGECFGVRLDAGSADEVWLRDAQGRERWFRLAQQPFGTSDGAPPHVLTLTSEVTEEKRREQRDAARRAMMVGVTTGVRIDNTLRKLAAVVERQLPGVVCCIWYPSPTGLRPAHTVAMPPEIAARLSALGVELYRAPAFPSGAAADTVIYRGEIEGAPSASAFGVELRAPAETRYCVTWAAAVGERGAEAFIDVLSARPVSSFDDFDAVASFASELAAVAIETRNRHAALSRHSQEDPLTKLPNRVQLATRLESALKQAKRTAEREKRREEVGLFVIDIDDFKRFNDTLGHARGDALLREVAGRLEHCKRPGDTLARADGDEFVMVVQGLCGANDASRIAQRIAAAMLRPFDITGFPLQLTVSIGIAMFPEDATDGRTLLQRAGAALTGAKSEGRNEFRFFQRAMHDSAVERLDLETALRRAIANGDLQLYMQGQHDIRTGRVVGFESLARWTDADRGVIPPGKFIPLAEDAHLIGEIGCWALEQTCAAARRWLDDGLPPLTFSVNVSPRQLDRPDFVERIADSICRHGIPGKVLEIEIVESALTRDFEQTVKTLAGVRELGVRVAIDDFGTGYSSLERLATLPIDRLKIDRAFVLGIRGPSRFAAVSAATLRLAVDVAPALGIDVVAEGVETERQRDDLRALGCTIAQGYLYHRPEPAELALARTRCNV